MVHLLGTQHLHPASSLVFHFMQPIELKQIVSSRDRGNQRHPGRATMCQLALRQTAKTRQLAYRRAGTNSPRCAARAASSQRPAARRSRPCSPRERRHGCERRPETASATWIRRSSRRAHSRSPDARNRAGR